MPLVPIQQHTTKTLSKFQVDPERGFLPSPDPIEALPSAFSPWEEIAHDLPKLLAAGKLRPVLED